MDFINNLYGDIFDRIFKLILLLPVAVILFSLAAYFVKKSGWYKHIFISASQWIISIPYVKQLANYTPKNINERVVKLKSWILGISGTLLFSCFVLVGIRIEINDTLNDLLITGITFFAGIYIFIELIFYRYKTIRDDKYKKLSDKISFKKLLKNYFNSIGILLSFFLILMPFFMVHSKTYQKVSVDKLNASSSLNQANSGEFFPHNILNENSNPWIEGKSSDGIGEYADMHFTTSFRFNRISIINGFNDKIKFKKYNRVNELEIKTKDYTRTVVLEDSSKAQSFNFEKKIKVEKIRFSIVSVYKGSSFNSTCLSKVVFFLNENKVSIGLIPKYKLCSIEKRMDHTFYTSDSFGNFSEISIDNYGEVKTKEWNKGFTSRKGTYIIDMQTLKKRSVIKIGPPEEARILRDLWSAKIVFSYDDKTSYEDYLFEDYLELKLNNSSNNTFEFTK